MRTALLLAASSIVVSAACAAPINSGSDGTGSSIPSGENPSVVNADHVGALPDAYYPQEAAVDVRAVMEDVNPMLAEPGIEPRDTSGDIPETESAADALGMDDAEVPELPELDRLFELEDVDTSPLDPSTLECDAGDIVSSKRQVDESVDQAFADGGVPMIVEEPETEEE